MLHNKNVKKCPISAALPKVNSVKLHLSHLSGGQKNPSFPEIFIVISIKKSDKFPLQNFQTSAALLPEFPAKSFTISIAPWNMISWISWNIAYARHTYVRVIAESWQHWQTSMQIYENSWYTAPVSFFVCMTIVMMVPSNCILDIPNGEQNLANLGLIQYLRNSVPALQSQKHLSRGNAKKCNCSTALCLGHISKCHPVLKQLQFSISKSSQRPA